MAATLQERLNYLVNYSSQLIFVGGDTLSSQTKALESFLFQQGENTEIAYVVAEPNIDISDFRFDLCKQLLGHASQFYHRPLNECLASLNHFDGPIMIAITRAERMPKKLLQELWELVLQSRFAGNKQHLNVILFADKRWASEAKTWLPANNSGTPLLLSTQQASLYKAMPNTLRLGTQDNRGLPRTNIAVRAEEQDIEQRPLASMAAFWVASALLFICAFVGVAVWQKGGEFSTLFAPIAKDDSTIKLARQPNQLEQASSLPQSPLDKINPNEPDMRYSNNKTVLEWGKNAASNEKAPAAQSESATTANTPLTSLDPSSVEPMMSTALTQSENATEAKPAVSDLPSKHNQARVVHFEADRFAVQLAGFKSSTALDRFQRENKLENISTVYRTKRYGGDWYVLVHKPIFDSRREAKSALYSLPNFATKSEAFVKSTNDIIKELRLVKTASTLGASN